MTTIIGCDLSTNTGLAVIDRDSGDIVHHEEVKVPKGVTGWERVYFIAARIMEAKEKSGAVAAIIEGYGLSQFGAAVTLIEIGTVVRFLLWQDSFPYIDVPPSSLKKFVTGSGAAKKDNMLLEVYKRWGFDTKSNDIADAVGLCHFGRCLYQLETQYQSYTKWQHDAVLSGLKDTTNAQLAAFRSAVAP